MLGGGAVVGLAFLWIRVFGPWFGGWYGIVRMGVVGWWYGEQVVEVGSGVPWGYCGRV